MKKLRQLLLAIPIALALILSSPEAWAAKKKKASKKGKTHYSRTVKPSKKQAGYKKKNKRKSAGYNQASRTLASDKKKSKKSKKRSTRRKRTTY